MAAREQRGQLALEDAALLAAVFGDEELARILAVHARQDVAGGNEVSEQAMAIEVGAEIADARRPMRSRDSQYLRVGASRCACR